MKTAIIHISDFHIKENDHFIIEKIDKMITALNVLGKIDKYIAIFSGDLAYSGKVNEYRKAKFIIRNIYGRLKNLSNTEKVELLMVPGNHDMVFGEDSRECDDIIKYYKENKIDQQLEEEIKKFDNFYNESGVRMSNKKDKIIDNYYINSGNIKFQINLINSAYFSTLKPNDKELHYFPLDRLNSLKKKADISITVMHHTTESYNGFCKNALENKLYQETDILLTGHNHFSQTKQVNINDKGSIIESCGGEMNFTDQYFNDVFNVLLIDNDSLLCNGYSFKWLGQENIFKHDKILNDCSVKKSEKLYPLIGYMKELHDDPGNRGKDFTKYFIFPKLSKKNNCNYGDDEHVVDESSFINEILKNKRIIIYGGNSSGKTTLIKKLFMESTKEYVPLILDIYPSMKIKLDKFIKNIFEDQYGDDPINYEKFQQLHKSQKVIFVDNIDLLFKIKYFKINDFYKRLIDNFEYIIVTSSSKNNNIQDVITNELRGNDEFYEYEINPFFLKKRNELVCNICKANNISNQKDIDKINNIVDNLVHNNNELFSLTPSFLVKYIQYFTGDNHYEYVKGEKFFNKIFEYDLCESLLVGCERNELDTYLTIYEIIAYKMFKDKKDTLDADEIRNIIDDYNRNYGMKINCQEVIDLGEKSKIIKKNEDYKFYFLNKNHLAYFIAKRLFFNYQNEGEFEDVNYALKNICFGINSNIIMFYIYLSNNFNSIYKLNDDIDSLLSEVTSLDLDKLNVPFLKKKDFELIDAPEEDDRENINNQIEKNEEVAHSERDVTALGIFDFDESDIDKFENKINRAFTYLEIICKSIPSFYSKITLEKKEKLKTSVYKYPEKIAYVMLAPLNNDFENLCDWFIEYVNQNNIKKDNGKEYIRADIVDFLQGYGIAIVLSLFDHFSEMCTTENTVEFMTSGEHKKNTNKLQKLLMLELEAPLNEFTREAKKMLEESGDWLFQHMIRLIVRKHLLVNKSIEYNDKQSIVDTFFGKENRKKYLLDSLKE